MATGNKTMSALYRKSNGRIMGKAKAGIPVLILTVKGRKSGVEHPVPVAYFEHDGSYVVIGSAGGAKAEPQWTKNLLAAGKAKVQVRDQTFDVTARFADGEDREALWREIVARAPGYADYETKSGRTLAVVVLNRA
jgi:deazaflavin-dependent oxidoreductase (nitroreductase family)